MQNESVRRRVTVRGQVQAVGYRWSAKQQADRIGARGYVRNLPDGSVELEVEGTPDVVDRMLAWAASGPPHAVVESVDATATEPTGDPGFDIRP